MKGFPLWAKIWEASGICADFISHLPVEPDKTMLELGAGLGVVGIFAASMGHRVVMTEYNDDALNFAKANALLNHCHDIDIIKLDWHRPSIQDTFDYIIGSEIIFKEDDIRSISNIIQRRLKPDGQVVLVEGIRRTGIEFYGIMSKIFEIKAHKKVLRSEDEEIPFVLFEMKYRSSE